MIESVQVKITTIGVNGHLPSELEGLKDLLQGEVLAVPEDDHLPRFLAQLALDEAQQMLLVHACAVVHVSVNLRSNPCC